MNNVLTRDNPPLSRLTMADQPTPVTLVSAINCTSPAPSTVADYIRESLAENMKWTPELGPGIAEVKV
jgi:hypothetical protein